jgi:hypothetical protein
MASITEARSALGNTIKYHPDDHEAIEAARGRLEAAKIARALDDPVALARAAAIVRTAIARGRLTPGQVVTDA